jgi:hypothetical protein
VTVRASVRTLIADEASVAKNEKEALRLLETFLDRLAHVRILDPACGTGNFLYVSLDVLKRIENEVLDMYANLGGGRIASYGRLVSPKQFLGIEIKHWAKEIAELVLWIGYLQWQIRTRGFANDPEEPIFHDYHNIECRDAVLAYDEKMPLLDDDGNPVTRWDGETMKRHPVTGEDVPDDTARVPVFRYLNPRKAKWPDAEFIIGNPVTAVRRIHGTCAGGGQARNVRTVRNRPPSERSASTCMSRIPCSGFFASLRMTSSSQPRSLSPNHCVDHRRHHQREHQGEKQATDDADGKGLEELGTGA